MLADVRTFDRLSVAKEMSVWQAVKRMGGLWQQCMVLHFTRYLNGLCCTVLPLLYGMKEVINKAHKKNVLRRVWEAEERQRLPDRRQMLPRKREVIGLCRVSLSFASRTLGTAVTGRRTTPLPATYCHKLPPHCKAIVQCRHWFYFAGETDY